MNRKVIGIFTLVAAAGAAVFALTRGAPRQQVPPTDTPAPVAPTVTASPTVTAEYKPCYFVWATQGLPEISADFEAAIQSVLPTAGATASAYGENCVAEDGSATFGAMETDFYVRVNVEDLKDDAALGTMVEQALTIIIEQFPRPIVPGGQDGFVEFTFVAGSEQRVLRVPIPRGKELLEQGLHGAELLQALEGQ